MLELTNAKAKLEQTLKLEIEETGLDETKNKLKQTDVEIAKLKQNIEIKIHNSGAEETKSQLRQNMNAVLLVEGVATQHFI